MSDGGGAGGGGGNPMTPAGVAGPNQAAPEEGYLLIQVHVPELNVQKCLQFPRDQLVWDVKQQCLAALPKELKESFNYGLFSPPVNGKAGKFLDEERRLGDYPFNGPIGYLELKYKRRVYKMLNLDEKQLKALHTRSNLRRLLDYVTHGQVEKITKMCSKGLDPNFHCQETGETPLTLAVGIKKPGKVLMALVNGGAILDYRTRDGSTAMHRAVEKGSLEALTTLLELGASPNYKDGKGLSPLYLTVTHRTDPMLAQTLLHDRAVIGAQDLQGWQEVHQACRNGLVVHLEHLLSYGADMNSKNASGNTPLHVCAVNNQDSSARMLLFRGCQRDALNYANQTPYQVAVIAGNLELAEVIQNFRSDQVVPYREPPQFNPRRRRYSDIYGTSLVTSPSTTSNLDAVLLPPSPSLSNRSVPPYSYASSSMSETSSGSSTQPSVGEDSVSIITDKSVDETSDSSGVGTATSDLSNSISLPGTTVICLENYSSNLPGHLSIMQGDILEVTGATDCGLLEGTLRGRGSGLFPAHCVQEVMLRPGSANGSVSGSAGSTSTLCRSTARVLGRREANNKHFATAPRQKKQLAAEPRTVVLHRSRKGFGFVLRGAKATSPLMELQPSERCPGLQYLDDVDTGGVADLAGLRKGDYLVAINGEDVSSASHEHVVSLIRRSGDLVQMTVVSASAMGISTVPNSKSSMTFSCSGSNGTGTAPSTPPTRQYATLPRKLSNNSTLGRSPAPLPPRRDPRTTLSVGRARARSMVAGLEGGGEREEGLDNSTGRSSSAESIHCASGSNSNTGSIAGGLNMSHALQGNGNQPRTASIRARPTSSRITATELEELFQRQQGSGGSALMSSYFQCGMGGSASSSQPASPARTPRVYNSVAEMKRMKGKANTRVRFSIAGISGISELHRDFHSTPDLAARSGIYNGLPNGSIDHRVPKGHRSEDDVTTIINGRPPLPPPNHPPPPPPTQIVKVDLKDSNGSSKGEYINTAGLVPDSNESYMSSFRPSSSAKLYASPDEIKAVGYRSTVPANSRPQVRKSQSLRSPPTTHKPTLQHQMSDQGPTLVTTISIGSSTGTNATTNGTNSDTNQYAQPFRCRRSLSTKERREAKSRLMANQAAANASQVGGPPIPDPDYSLSEGEGSEGDSREVEGAVVKGSTTNNEGSGNSESSSGSGSLTHSFSVDEIQKVRTRLKSSKSYPNDFLLNQDGTKDGNEGAIEDGDNSSSGVSSDQDIPIGPSSLEQNQPIRSVKFQQKPSQVITSCMTLPSQRQQQQQRAAYHSQGILTRNAVSLAQLPPPLEAEADEPAPEGVFVPPPPQFGAAGGPTPTEEVFAPPPQFCDNRLVTRVRIVGTTPKGVPSMGGGRLNRKPFARRQM